MKQLLHAKHWQIFLLFVGLPMIAQFLMVGLMTSGNVGIAIFLSVAVGLISGGVFFLWLWSVGNFLHSILPEEVHMNVRRFRSFLVFPVVYIASFLIIFLFLIGQIEATGDFIAASYFALIIPLHLFAMFCIFYTFYFIAKALKSVELKREARSGDYLGDFFLIWFYFIGIWILQPKINALANDPMTGIEDHLVD